MNPNEVLVQAMTADQQETVTACPDKAVQYAIKQVHKKRKLVNFGYFMGIIKSYLASEEYNNEQPTTKKTAKRANPSHSEYVPNTETTTERSKRLIKQGHQAYLFEQGRVAHEGNPYWRGLHSSQRAEMFEVFPHLKEKMNREYVIVKGLSNPAIPSVTEPVDLETKEPMTISTAEPIRDTMSHVETEIDMTDNDDYVNYDAEFHTLFER